jgi:glutamate synthase domain-containing protein 3
MLATVLLALIIGAYYVGRYRGNPHHKLKMRVAFTNIDKSKTLQLLKKRLEKHLELLQETRHERILTKEEKEIKEAIEKDLDEVDRAITEQKSK